MRLPRAAWVLIGLAGFCALSGGLFYATVWRDVDVAASRNAEARREADKVGAWRSVEEVRQASIVPLGQDAAPLYRRAKDQAGSVRPLVELAQSYRPGDPIEPLEAGLAGQKEALATLDQALARPRADWKVEWEKGVDAQLPFYAELRDWGRIQGARAVVAARRGRGEEAMRLLRAGQRVADHAMGAPTLIGYLVETAILSSLVSQYIDVAAALPRDSAVQSAVRADIGAFERRRSTLIEGMRSEGVMMRATIENIAAGRQSTTDPAADARALRQIPVLLKANETRMVERNTAVVETLIKAGDDPIAQHRAITAGLKQWDRASGISYLYVRIMSPVYDQASGVAVGRIARCRAALTVLDFLDAKRRTGAWPKRPPVERIDPFTDKPLLWSAEGDAVKVWSVGTDGDDDRGARGDVTVEHPRPRGRR